MTDVSDIIAAARAGDETRVRECLNIDPALARASNMFGSTAVHAAHFAGHPGIVDLLLAGAAPDARLAAELGLIDRLQDLLSEQPHLARDPQLNLLASAAYWGQVEASRLLLEHGADADAPTHDDFLQIRPLGAAVATPDTPNPSDDEAVVTALAQLLIDHGADLNGRRKDGLTALHTAAFRGHLQLVRLLLDAGADPAIAGLSGRHQGETALDTALAQDQLGAAELLSAAG